MRVVGLIVIFVFARTASAQWSADSMSRDERFWSQSGGYARQIALGAGGFGMLADNEIVTTSTNPFSVDPIFALQNPAYASHYPGLMMFDIGYFNNTLNGGVGQSFEGFFPASKNVTLGFVLARNDASTFSLVNPNLVSAMTSAPSPSSYSRPQTSWELLSSFKLGSADAGIAISYLSSDSGTSQPTNADSTASQYSKFSQIGISAGTLLKMGDAMLDVGAQVLLPSITQTTSTGETQTSDNEWSLMSIGINARAFIPTSSEFYLVPMLNYYLGSGTTTKIGSPKDLPTSSNLDAGLGVNFWAGGLHIMSGASFSHYAQTVPAIGSARPAVTHSETIFPRFTVGAEWPALKWLTLRMGYVSSSGSETRETAVDSVHTRAFTNGRTNLYSILPSGASQTGGVSAGAAFKIERFTFDVTLNTTLFHGGVASVFNGVGPFGYATMSYRFD
jgi:hypothetical protein